MIQTHVADIPNFLLSFIGASKQVIALDVSACLCPLSESPGLQARYPTKGVCSGFYISLHEITPHVSKWHIDRI